MKKIAIYNENCVAKGAECHSVDITEDGRAVNLNNEQENGDVTVYDLTEEEAALCDLRAKQAGAGSDLFWMRVARTIRENL